MKTKVFTPKAPTPGNLPFSQAIISNNLVFTQGCICLTTEGKMLEGTTEEQVRLILKNLDSILDAAGSSFEKLIKTTIYITEMDLYSKVNEVYSKFVKEPFPAREVICVKELPLGAKVEISMVAEIN